MKNIYKYIFMLWLSLTIGSAYAVGFQDGGFDSPIANTTAPWHTFEAINDIGWVSHDLSFTTSGNAATSQDSTATGWSSGHNFLQQMFTNTQTGNQTLSFDFEQDVGGDLQYAVFGWSGGPLSGNVMYANGQWATANISADGGQTVTTIVSGTLTDVAGGGATSLTTAAFGMTGYSNIAISFMGSSVTTNGLTIDNVSFDASAAVVPTTWLGTVDSDWNTVGNWDAGVPAGASATIGTGAAVTHAGDFDTGGAGPDVSQFTALDLAAGSSITYAGGGDFHGETWNIDGTVSVAQVAGFDAAGTTLNFGINGSFNLLDNLWGNSTAFNLTGIIDIASGASETVLTQDLMTWGGTLSAPFGTITSSFTELNGRPLTQLADNTVPANSGEYSLFQESGALSVHYMTIPAVLFPGDADLVDGGFDSFITETASVWFTFDMVDTGWIAHDAVWVATSGAAESQTWPYTQEAPGSVLVQAFTNTSSGEATLSFDYDSNGGGSATYSVVGWTNTPTANMMYINSQWATSEAAVDGVVLISGATGFNGTAAGTSTTITSAEFNLSEYAYIGVWLREDGRVAGRTIDNVVITSGAPNPPSNFSIETLGAGGGVALSWDTVEGQSYGVNTNGSLVTGSWNSYTANISGTGGTIIITNATDEVELFYTLTTDWE